MTRGVLAELAAFHDDLVSSAKAPPPGYALAKMAFCVVIDSQGRTLEVEDLRLARRGRLEPRPILAPLAPRRTRGVVSGSLWDKAAYALGRLGAPRGHPPLVPTIENDAFRQWNLSLLEESEDCDLNAFKGFLTQSQLAACHAANDIGCVASDNICFRVEGRPGYLHDSAAARMAVFAALEREESEASVQCAVLGSRGPLARIHPTIKGVTGAHTTGGSLVSFNAVNFTSYGRHQGENASVSQVAAASYSAALNILLGGLFDPTGVYIGAARRCLVGEMTLVYWSHDRFAEEVFACLVSGGTSGVENPASRSLIESLVFGGDTALETIVDLDAKVFILGLKPNQSRLAVRIWQEVRLGELIDAFQRLWRDAGFRSPGAGPLGEVFRDIFHDPFALNAGEHTGESALRAVLLTEPYPRSLFIHLMSTFSAHRRLGPCSVALLKSCCLQMSDDLAETAAYRRTSIGYRLGRLFAVLEATQAWGKGFFDVRWHDPAVVLACGRPAAVFPGKMLRLAAQLDAAMREGRGGRAARLLETIRDITEDLGQPMTYPDYLERSEQGYFVCGYYEQADALGVPSNEAPEVRQLTGLG